MFIKLTKQSTQVNNPYGVNDGYWAIVHLDRPIKVGEIIIGLRIENSEASDFSIGGKVLGVFTSSVVKEYDETTNIVVTENSTYLVETIMDRTSQDDTKIEDTIS